MQDFKSFPNSNSTVYSIDESPQNIKSEVVHSGIKRE